MYYNMNVRKNVGFAIVALFCCMNFSCGNDEASVIREKLKSGYSVSSGDKASGGRATKSQYLEFEKKMNEQYVHDLEALVSNGFEKQLDEYDKMELGFWQSLWRPFSYLFTSKSSRLDKYAVKSHLYFNSLDISQESHELYLDYIEDVRNLRTRYTTSHYKLSGEPQLNLPKIDIDLAPMDDYARAEIINDVLAEGLGWIGVLVVLALLCLVGIPFSSGITAIGTILSLLIGGFLGVHNDNKLKDAIRSQYTEEHIVEYDEILTELNQNTTYFYGK